MVLWPFMWQWSTVTWWWVSKIFCCHVLFSFSLSHRSTQEESSSSDLVGKSSLEINFYGNNFTLKENYKITLQAHILDIEPHKCTGMVLTKTFCQRSSNHKPNAQGLGPWLVESESSMTSLKWFRFLKKLTGKCYKSPARNRLQLRLGEVTREMITKRSKAKSGIGINLDKDTRKMSGLLSRKSLSRKGLTREGGSRTRSERQEIATAAAPVFSSFEAISIFKLDSHHFSELLLDPLFLIDFLSDPCPIIATLVTQSLTHSC